MMKNRGFTIVELLIVIVVIAILAAITIVSFNGVQARTFDARRLDDMNKIRKALEMYRVDKGEYPAANNSAMPNGDPTVPGASWESSTFGQSTWLNKLEPYLGKKAPVDPKNDTEHFYYYFFYANNTGTCGALAPNCYILGASKLDNTDVLNISGVDKAGSDAWRNSSATRAVWRGSY